MKKVMILLLLSLYAFLHGHEAMLREIKAGTRAEARLEWFCGNGEDCTSGMQNALDSGVEKLIIGKEHAPHWIAKSLQLRSDMEIFFEDGAQLQAMPGKFTGIQDMLLVARDAKNIKISGNGFLTMNRVDYQDKSRYAVSEWRHILGIFNSKNLTVENLTFRGSGGDGIYLMSGENLEFRKISCLDNLRQGLSIISAENLLIVDSLFAETIGTSPMAGIDFEPNFAKEKLVNCRIENCRFENNDGPGLLFALMNLNAKSLPISISVRGCSFFGNREGIMFSSFANPNVAGKILIENCQISSSRGASLLWAGQPADGFDTILKDIVIAHDSKSAVAIDMRVGASSGAFGNLAFSNVAITDSIGGREPVEYSAYASHPLRKLTGKISANGEELKLSDMVRLSEKECKVKEPVINWNTCVPLHKDLVTTTPAAPFQGRLKGQFLQYAKAGENIAIEVLQQKIGQSPVPTAVQLLDPAEKVVKTYQVSADQPGKIEFKAEMDGIYRLIYSTAHGIRFISAHPGNGFAADQTLSGIFNRSRSYFMVRAGAAAVALTVSGDNEVETVDAILYDSNGKEVARADKVFAPKLLMAERTNPGEDEIWSIGFNSFEDCKISILGDAIPVLSDAPEKVLTYVNK